MHLISTSGLWRGILVPSYGWKVRASGNIRPAHSVLSRLPALLGRCARRGRKWGLRGQDARYIHSKKATEEAVWLFYTELLHCPSWQECRNNNN
eukprot:gene19282-biopygen4002